MEDKTIIIGRNPVLEYLKKGSLDQGARLYVSSGAHGKIIDTIKSQARSTDVILEVKDKAFFASLGNARHQGVMLQLPRLKGTGSIENQIEQLYRDGKTIIVLDNITDPHNTGAIIRTGEALGAGAIVWPKSNSSGLTQAALKTSAGATAHILTSEVTNISRFLDTAKKTGYWIIGTSQDANTAPWQLDTSSPLVLIIGSEGSGMRRLTREHCDYLVTIPLEGKVASLNASVAAGIMMYEIITRSKTTP